MFIQTGQTWDGSEGTTQGGEKPSLRVSAPSNCRCTLTAAKAAEIQAGDGFPKSEIRGDAARRLMPARHLFTGQPSGEVFPPGPCCEPVVR